MRPGPRGLRCWLAVALAGWVSAVALSATPFNPAGACAGAPAAGDDWRDLARWGLAAGGGVAAILVLASAHRRQTHLVRAMHRAQAAARAVVAKEAAHAECERFATALTLALQGQETLDAFGTLLLERLCRRLDAKAAAFHCLDTAAGVYVLAAQYAGNLNPAFIERYRPGDGVAGQVVLDRRRQVCEGTAADWMWVTSGTQVSAPLAVIVAPVVSGDRVPGVVELALMRRADAASLALLDEVLPVVALSLGILLTKLEAGRELERRDRLLRDSEFRLRTLFDTANEGIWVIDTQVRTTDLNPAMARILGLPREAVLGHTLFEFVDAANAAILRDQMERRRRGETGAYEIAFSRSDGRQVPCLLHASPLFDARGERIGAFAMVAELRGGG